MNKFNFIYITIFIFFIILSKELILINEEIILILSFSFFFFSVFDLLSNLLNNELQNRPKQILLVFNEFFAIKKNSLIYINLLNKQLNNLDIELITLYENTINSIEIFKNNYVASKDLMENSIISNQLSVLSVEQLSFLSITYNLKLNKVINSLRSTSRESSTTHINELNISFDLDSKVDSINYLNFFYADGYVAEYLLTNILLTK